MKNKFKPNTKTQIYYINFLFHSNYLTTNKGTRKDEVLVHALLCNEVLYGCQIAAVDSLIEVPHNFRSGSKILDPIRVRVGSGSGSIDPDPDP
jgi:hypothetical protein